MTLCVAWKRGDRLHFASDSRLTLSTNSYADVGIKVLSVPYRIFSATDQSGNRTLDFEGELGMCFAGSAINSLLLKETVVELLRDIQYAAGYSDTSMDGLAAFVFKAYKLISQNICATTMRERGRAEILLSGHCSRMNSLRSFLLTTDNMNHHSFSEVLVDDGHEFLGSGKSKARNLLPIAPTDRDFFEVLRKVINDDSVPGVGGNIQYGTFEGKLFRIFGIVELAEGVHYWRGGIDLNSQNFMGTHDALVPAYKYIDPFQAFLATDNDAD